MDAGLVAVDQVYGRSSYGKLSVPGLAAPPGATEVHGTPPSLEMLKRMFDPVS